MDFLSWSKSSGSKYFLGRLGSGSTESIGKGLISYPVSLFSGFKERQTQTGFELGPDFASKSYELSAFSDSYTTESSLTSD
jgi:hypothetical protein